MLTKREDAFGQALYDAYMGAEVTEIVERDDHLFSAGPMSRYLNTYHFWPKIQQKP